jgi:RHS repeat-associated protein
MNPATGSMNSSTQTLAYTYDAKNRLSKAQIGANAADAITYKINAMGQRVQKIGAGAYAFNSSLTIDTATGQSPLARTINFNARYVYDEQGRLIGEYAPDGKLISETVYFNDLPIVTMRPKGANNGTPLGIAGTTTGNPSNGATAANANNVGNNSTTNRVNVEVFYIHADHLGTPRTVTRSTVATGANAPSSATANSPGAVNKAVWRWDSDPFGTSLDNSKPTENPQIITGTATVQQAGTFKQNLRFPGQLADGESAKYYNYFRDYDSTIGRYTTSDPIGLRGGINTYGYVKQRPTVAIDPFGLADFLPPNPNYPTSVVVCRGGYPSPQLQRLPPVYQKCISHCLYEHELLHVDDLMGGGYASICKGKPDGTILQIDIVFNAQSEARARKLEIDCLRRSMGKKNYCDECTPIIQDRLRSLGAN